MSTVTSEILEVYTWKMAMELAVTTGKSERLQRKDSFHWPLALGIRSNFCLKKVLLYIKTVTRQDFPSNLMVKNTDQHAA